jgi:hypothetical protein
MREIDIDLLEKYSHSTPDLNVTYVDFPAIIAELDREKRRKQYEEIGHSADHLEPEK